MTTTQPSKQLIRRAEALEITGLTDAEFSKAVNAEVIEPVHLIWQVRDHRNAVLFETTETKARAEAARINGTAEPVGRAHYRREQIQSLIAK